MSEHTANPARLYLPLLSHSQAEVRRQACTIMFGTYGERSLTYLRRLLDDADPQVRKQALRALQIVGDATGLRVELQPFRGMYIECLGSLHVYLDSHEVQLQDWMQLDGGRAGWRKVQGVFAYLVHSGRRGATRETLGEAIWGGVVSPSSLSRTLTALRQVLASVGDPTFAERALIITREYCLLAPDSYHTDMSLFERTFNMASHVEQTQGLDDAVALYGQALKLYNGPYMADVPHSNEWSQERRDLLMNDFVIAAERLAEHAYGQRHYRQCITFCRQALEADQTADDVTAWLLRAYAQLGLSFELEQTYQRYIKATSLTPELAENRQDPVIQLYHELRGSVEF